MADATIERNDFGSFPRSVQAQLAEKQSRQATRHNSALPDDSWGVVDDTVYQTMDQTLRIVSDLMNAGLTSSAPVTAQTSEWHVVDDQGNATVAMDPETADAESSVDFGIQGVPLPCIYDSFSTGYRENPAPGEAPSDAANIDTLGASVSSRNVAERMERLVLDGWEETFEDSSGQSYDLYGLTNHPQRSTGTLGDWSTGTSTVRDDIRSMITDITDTNDFSAGGMGLWLYLGRNRYESLDDIDTAGDGSVLVRDRVENLSNLGAVREADFLGPDEAVMFRPTQDVIDLSIPREPTPITWEGPAGFRDNMMVMGIMAPRVKATKSGQSGVSHYTA